MSANLTLPIKTSVLGAVWQNKRLWLLHLFGGALLLLLGYAWLWIPDEKVWELIGTVLLGAVILVAVLWIEGGTLAFFRQFHAGGKGNLWPSFHAVLRRLPALAVWTAILLFFLWLIGLSEDHLDSWGGALASWMTMTVRYPVHPRGLVRILETLQWLVAWGLLPLLLLPLAEIAASASWRAFGGAGLRAAAKRVWSWRYWLIFAVLFLVGAYLPERVVLWVPEASRMATQSTSLAIRFVIAYVLAVSVGLVLLSFLGRRGAEGT